MPCGGASRIWDDHVQFVPKTAIMRIQGANGLAVQATEGPCYHRGSRAFAGSSWDASCGGCEVYSRGREGHWCWNGSGEESEGEEGSSGRASRDREGSKEGNRA